MDKGWQPSADQAVLVKRAQLLAEIRAFFLARDVLEVDVPLLGLTGVSDVHIDCLRVVEPHQAYLQSSPEYFMKRLLAAHADSIYYLGKAFRLGELGSRHYPEFTMLEWYRVAWDEHRLMDEVLELLASLGLGLGDTLRLGDSTPGYYKTSYRKLFQKTLSIDPHSVELATLRELASEVANQDFKQEDRATCLDLIFSLQIEPQLPRGITLVHDYPACQAALAEMVVDEEGVSIARRFEVFIDGMELANGYYELTDARALRERFAADNVLRQKAGKPLMAVDEKLLGAMAAGLPACAGVALGVDRLLMILLGVAHIQAVLPFADLDRN